MILLNNLVSGRLWSWISEFTCHLNLDQVVMIFDTNGLNRFWFYIENLLFVQYCFQSLNQFDCQIYELIVSPKEKVKLAFIYSSIKGQSEIDELWLNFVVLFFVISTCKAYSYYFCFDWSSNLTISFQVALSLFSFNRVTDISIILSALKIMSDILN